MSLKAHPLLSEIHSVMDQALFPFQTYSRLVYSALEEMRELDTSLTWGMSVWDTTVT